MDKRIEKLLHSHTKKVNHLNKEEMTYYDEIKKELDLGLVENILSSIREFVALNPDVRTKIVPGSIGAFLLGCLYGDSQYCLVEEEEDEENIFVADGDSFNHILIRPSLKAHLYFPQGFQGKLTSSQESLLALKGITQTEIFVEENGEYVPYNSNPWSGVLNKQEMLIFILVVVVLFFGIYILFPKFIG